jgi:hypothetical protein
MTTFDKGNPCPTILGGSGSVFRRG